MLTIIIGIILAGGIFCICYFFLIDSDYEEFALTGFAISFLLLVISLILGLFVPIQGFDEKTLEKETSLVVFSDNINSDDYGIYLYSFYDDTYMYKYLKSADKEKGELYDTKKLSSKDVKKDEITNLKEPILKEYKREPIHGVWSFALCDSKKEYIFKVPKGSIKYVAANEQDAEEDNVFVPYYMPE